jgi:WD40 repeat protein
VRLFDDATELWSTAVPLGLGLSASASPSRRRLVVQGANDVWVYTAGARELVAIGAHNAPVLAATFDAGEHRLVTTGEDGSAIVWDVDAKRELRRLVTDKLYLAAARFDATDHVIVAIDGGGQLQLFDADTGELVASIDGVLRHALGFMREGDRFAGVGNNGAIVTWQIDRDTDPLAAAEHDLACLAPPGERVGTCR